MLGGGPTGVLLLLGAMSGDSVEGREKVEQDRAVWHSDDAEEEEEDALLGLVTPALSSMLVGSSECAGMSTTGDVADSAVATAEAEAVAVAVAMVVVSAPTLWTLRSIRVDDGERSASALESAPAALASLLQLQISPPALHR